MTKFHFFFNVDINYFYLVRGLESIVKNPTTIVKNIKNT